MVTPTAGRAIGATHGTPRHQSLLAAMRVQCLNTVCMSEPDYRTGSWCHVFTRHPPCVGPWATGDGDVLFGWFHSSAFLPRLRSTPVTALQSYYAGSDFPPGLCRQRDLPSSRVCASFRAVPNHPMPPCRNSLFSVFVRQASRASTPLAAGHSSTRVWASPLHSRLATAPNRNGFVSLRPGSSFPVALHLVL